jgi:hypothetical protein
MGCSYSATHGSRDTRIARESAKRGPRRLDTRHLGVCSVRVVRVCLGYLDPAVQFPEDAKKLGRWIGVAHDVGSPMTFWILPASCKVIARSTVTALSDDEKADPVVQQRMAELDLSVKEKIGDTLKDEELDPAMVELFPEVPDDFTG